MARRPSTEPNAELPRDDEAASGPGKSKSQVKRELHALKAVVQAMIALPARQLDELPLSEELAAAIRDAQGLERGALQRQLRYCVGLLARETPAEVEHALAALRRPHGETVRAQHEIERWRDALLVDAPGVMEELVGRYPALDRQHLLHLVRAARHERAGGHPPRSARLLYRYLAGFREGE